MLPFSQFLDERNSKVKIEYCQGKSLVLLDSVRFFDRVKEALGAKNAPEIAEKLGLVKQSVYLWQKGSFPALDTLSLIAESSNTSLHWLLTGEGQKFVKKTLEPSENVDYKNAADDELITLALDGEVDAAIRELATDEDETPASAVEKLVVEALIRKGKLRITLQKGDASTGLMIRVQRESK